MAEQKPIDFEAITAACEHLDSNGMKAAADAIRALDESREEAIEQRWEFMVSTNHLAFHRAELRAYAQWLERRIGENADDLRRKALLHEDMQRYLAASDPKRAAAEISSDGA